MGNTTSGFNLYALFYVAESFGQLVRKPLPPITVRLIGLTTIMKLLMYLFNKKLLSIYEYSVLPAYVVDNYFATSSLFVSNLVHADIMHFVTNSLSLLQVAGLMERFMQQVQYLKCLFYSSFMPNVFLVGLTKLLSIISERSYGRLHYYNLYFGQTSQILCLSTILQFQYLSHVNAYTVMFGLRIPSHYAVWVELLINQMFMPVPIVSHFSGVLAGLFYVYFLPNINIEKTDFGIAIGNSLRYTRLKLSKLFGYNNYNYYGSNNNLFPNRHHSENNSNQFSWATHMEGATSGGYVNNRLSARIENASRHIVPQQQRQQLSREEIRRRRLLRLDSDP